MSSSLQLFCTKMVTRTRPGPHAFVSTASLITLFLANASFVTYPKRSPEPHLTPTNAPNHRPYPLQDATTTHHLQTPATNHGPPNEARTASLLRSSTRELLSRQQLIRTKRHGQKLLQRHDRVLAQLVVHQYRRVGLQNSIVSQNKSRTQTQIPKVLEDEILYLHRRTRE